MNQLYASPVAEQKFGCEMPGELKTYGEEFNFVSIDLLLNAWKTENVW